MSKKQPKNWYIAFTHWLTAGFAAPVLMGVAIGLPAMIVIGKDRPITTAITLSIIHIAGLSIGAIYASKYTNKTYSVKKPESIINLSTMYFIVTSSAMVIAIAFQKAAIVSNSVLTIIIAALIIEITLFYKLSTQFFKK